MLQPLRAVEDTTSFALANFDLVPMKIISVLSLFNFKKLKFTATHLEMAVQVVSRNSTEVEILDIKQDIEICVSSAYEWQDSLRRAIRSMKVLLYIVGPTTEPCGTQ